MFRPFQAALCLPLALALAGRPAQPADSPDRSLAPAGPWFEEVAAAAGVDFVHVRARTVRYWLPEIMSGGAAWCDLDGDGWLDLYLVQGGDLEESSGERPGNRLYRNLGDGRFTDVTQRAGVGDAAYGMGAACGDYDGDGDVDLYVTNVGPNVLYRNDGDGTFTDVTEESGTGDPRWGASAAFLDFDRDGDLDLFVANYVVWSPAREIRCASGSGRRDYCKPGNYGAPARDTLLRNEGDGRFTDVSRESGIAAAFGNGLGVVVDDFNRDRLADLYVANDGDPNQLWVNLGGGRFRDDSLLSGVAVNMTGAAEAGMGVIAEDLDDDGDTDLFMTHLRGESNTLYRNAGGHFEDATATAGLAAPSLAFTGFGSGAHDFDLDGLRDLYVANGRVVGSRPPLIEDDPFAEPDLLFRGLGAGRFAFLPGSAITAPELVDNGRAAAVADYDNDGDVDVAVVVNGGRARLLRNLAGDRGRWLASRVLDERGSDALGARVRVRTGDGDRWSAVRAAYSYCASNDPRPSFGLGEAVRAEEVEIVWPDGSRRRLANLPAGRILVHGETRRGRREASAL